MFGVTAEGLVLSRGSNPEIAKEDPAASSSGATQVGKPARDKAGTGRETASRRPRSASSD